MDPAIKMIAVGELRLPDDNVREHVGDVSELAASIKVVGIIEPLIVDDDWLVVCGTRRLAAAVDAKLQEVPCIVRTFDQKERLTVAAVENLQRASLTPLEEARTFQRLSDMGMTTRQVAAQLGISQSWVSKRTSLLKLPESTQEKVATGKIELQQAQELVRVADDPKLVERLAKKAEDGSQYTANDVTRALEKKEMEKLTAKAEAVLTKAGENVVSLKEDYFKPVAPKGCAIVVKTMGYGQEGIQMDPAKHATMACHAVGVHPRTQETIEVCTSPSVHPDPKQEKKKAEDKRIAQLAAEKQRAQAELDDRIAFLRTIALGRLKEKVVLDTAYRAVVEYEYGWSNGALALRVLGLDAELAAAMDKAPEGTEIDDSEFFELRCLEIAKTYAGRLRVLFAFACDRIYRAGELDVVLNDLGYESPTVAVKEEATA